MNHKVNTNLHSPLLLSRQSENKKQYPPIEIDLSRLIFFHQRFLQLIIDVN